MLTLLLSSFKVSAQEGEIEAGYIEIEDIGKDMQLEAISTKKVDKIQMSQYGKQVIPSKPLKASEDIVNKGIPLYRISIKVKAFDASNKIVSNAKITVSTTSTGVVKGMKTSGYTDSKGEGYIYVDVRGAATFSITAHINNTKKTEKYMYWNTFMERGKKYKEKVEAEQKAKIAEKEANGQYVYEYQVLNNHLSKQKADNFIAENAGINSRYVYLHGHGGVNFE